MSVSWMVNQAMANSEQARFAHGKYKVRTLSCVVRVFPGSSFLAREAL